MRRGMVLPERAELSKTLGELRFISAVPRLRLGHLQHWNDVPSFRSGRSLWLVVSTADSRLQAVPSFGNLPRPWRRKVRSQEPNAAAIAQRRFIVNGFTTRDEHRHLLNIGGNTVCHAVPNEGLAIDAELRGLGLIEMRSPSARLSEFIKGDGQAGCGSRVSTWTPFFPHPTPGADHNRLK